MTPTRLAACCAALLLSTSAAGAHDVWVTVSGKPQSRRAVVNYGHPGDRPPAFADKIVDLVSVTADGKTSFRDGMALKIEKSIVVVESKAFVNTKPALIGASYDNGYWVKLHDGTYRNATKRLVPDAAESMWSVKFAKAITAAGAPWKTQLGYELEIVPLSDPASLKRGDTLRVRVMLNGKPLANAQVERGDGYTKAAENDIPRFNTDDLGIASVSLVKSRETLLVVDHRTVAAVGQDAVAYNATLWFHHR